MRFLHTSDLHLGHRLCDRDRLDEHERLLDWLLNTAGEQHVDCIIIAGDIFDTSVPSNTALRLYYRFLASMPRYGVQAALIIGGNHDSPSALNAPRDLLEALNIHVRGIVSPQPEDDVIVLTGKEGERIACALVPYLRERDIRSPKGGESVEERDLGIREGIRVRFAETRKALVSAAADASIVIGHLFTAGAETSGGERDLYVGNLGHIGTDILPSGASYTALGHIHRAGEPGPGIRYSGAPLAMDFGDTGFKSVAVFDLPAISKDETASVEVIPVPAFRSLVRISGKAGDILEEIARTGKETAGSDSLGTWAEVRVEAAAADPYLSSMIEEECSRAGIALLRIHLEAPESDESGDSVKVPLEDVSPHEMFALKCRHRAVEPDETLKLAFSELLAEIEREGEEDNAGED